MQQLRLAWANGCGVITLNGSPIRPGHWLRNIEQMPKKRTVLPCCMIWVTVDMNAVIPISIRGPGIQAKQYLKRLSSARRKEMRFLKQYAPTPATLDISRQPLRAKFSQPQTECGICRQVFFR